MNVSEYFSQDAQGGEAPYVPPPPPEDESAIFQSIPTGINFAKYDDIPVEISGRAAPNSLVGFEDAQFQQKIMENIYRAKFDKPTPIQKNAIPIVQAGRDLMACAQTGSGKTVSSLLYFLIGFIRSKISVNNTRIHPTISHPEDL